MFRFLADSFKRNPTPRTKTRLSLETLELREVPTAGIAYDPHLLSVDVTATNGGDRVYFSIDENGTTGQYNSHWDDKLVVKWTHGGVTQTQSFNLFSQPRPDLAVPLINRVSFQGGSGNDKVVNNTVIASWLFGKNGKDYLVGGNGNDYIIGGKGSDTIYGNGGDDDLWGRAYYTGESDVDQATDRLYGGKGFDKLVAEGTRKTYLDGGDENDYLWGAYGQGITNYLNGGKGSDYLEGGYGTGAGIGVMNIMTDKRGIDRFYCADHALNIVHCKDHNPIEIGAPSEQYDRINKSGPGGLDLVSMDTSVTLSLLHDRYQSNLVDQVFYHQV